MLPDDQLLRRLGSRLGESTVSDRIYLLVLFIKRHLRRFLGGAAALGGVGKRAPSDIEQDKVGVRLLGDTLRLPHVQRPEMLRSRRRLLALFVAFGLTASVPLSPLHGEPSRERRLALVVVNRDYPGSPVVKSAGNDAREIAEALLEAGFAVTELTDINFETLREGVNRFSDSISPGDVALFYYNGHAFQSAGKNYLLPIGSDQTRGYSAQEVLDRVEGSSARFSIVIFDTDKNLARMKTDPTTAIATSSQGDGTREVAGNTNGLYTKRLLAALRHPGLKLFEVFNTVTQEVIKESGRNQIPWYSIAFASDFYFLPPNARLAPAPRTKGQEPSQSTGTVAHPGASGSGSPVSKPDADSPDLMAELLKWALKGLAGLVGICALGFSALLLLAWRRGSAALSKSWLLSLAAKPMLAIPGSGRRLLFLGYSRRLASQRMIADASQRYFGLPAEHEGGIVPPDPTGDSLHKAIASAAGPQCPVLILGSGGAGKSTLLARLAHLGLIGSLPPGLEDFRPVLIPASYYGTSLVKAVADTLRERDGVMVDEEMTRAQLQSGRFLILFDGVSEVVGERTDALNEILRTARHADYASCRFLITSRPLEGATVEAATFLLQPLAPIVVTKVLDSYKLGVARENRVRAQLERFGDRPIEPLLFTMILEQGADERFGTTRAEIFEQYFRRLLRIGSDKNLWDGWRDALELLSKHLMLDTGRRGAGLVHENLLNLLGERKVGEETVESATTRLRRLYHLPVVDELDMIGQLEAAGLLRRGRRWRFAHDTFEEYFAASYLASYLELKEQLPPLDQWREPAERQREFSGVLSFLREMSDAALRRRLCTMDLPEGWKAELAVADEEGARVLEPRRDEWVAPMEPKIDHVSKALRPNLVISGAILASVAISLLYRIAPILRVPYYFSLVLLALAAGVILVGNRFSARLSLAAVVGLIFFGALIRESMPGSNGAILAGLLNRKIKEASVDKALIPKALKYATPVKVVLDGLIALVPRQNQMTALLLDARLPLVGDKCGAPFQPMLSLRTESAKECLEAGCVLNGDWCDCDLARQEIYMQPEPLFPWHPLLKLPKRSMPTTPNEAVDFSYIANMTQPPLNMLLDPRFLGPEPPSPLVARMTMPFESVTACSLWAQRADEVQELSFRPLGIAEEHKEMSQALAQSAVIQFSIPDNKPLTLGLHDLDNPIFHLLRVKRDSHEYIVRLSNRRNMLVKDGPCADDVGRDFALFYELAMNPPVWADRPVPHGTKTQSSRQQVDSPECLLTKPYLPRPMCPMASFNP